MRSVTLSVRVALLSGSGVLAVVHLGRLCGKA